MTAIGKVDAVYREKTFPVEAVKLYTDISRRSISSVDGENPFANTRSLGLWQQPIQLSKILLTIYNKLIGYWAAGHKGSVIRQIDNREKI